MRPHTLISFLLLLGLICPSLSASCPDAADLPSSCECEDEFIDEEMDLELSCSDASLGEIKDALAKVDRKSRLSVALDEVTLGTLESTFFQGWNVVRLDISHCELDSLAEEGGAALSGLENTLEELIITSSFTEENQPTKLQLGHLRRLRELDLSFNAITELGDDWFEQGPVSLTQLILSNNGIEKMGDRALANLVNLRQLWFDGNRFGAIKRSMLPTPANHLNDLELDNNAFTSVPEDLFTDMPALKDVSLRTNGITHMPKGTFQRVWAQLDTLDIRGNPLECDSHIEWMFDEETNAFLSGRCESPRERKGMDLEELIQSRGV